MPAALQKPLSSSRPEMVAAHVPLALHDGVFVPARTVVAGRYGYDVRHRQIENVIQKPTARTYLVGQVPNLTQSSDMTSPPRRILCVSSLCSASCGKIPRYKRDRSRPGVSSMIKRPSFLSEYRSF